MALTDKNGFYIGLAVGVGAVLLAPVAAAALSGVGRPAARAAIKAGLMMWDKGRETAAELGEILEDLVAEAQAEINEPPSAAAQAADNAAQGGDTQAGQEAAGTQASAAAQ